MTVQPDSSPIAVIGMACWYPGARSPRELWENILARRRQFRRFPDERLPIADYYHPDRGEPDKTYGRRAAVISGFSFDWAARKIPLSTVKSTDIVHWLALETAIASLLDAGLSLDQLPGEKTGVLVGNTLTGEQTRSNTMRLRWPFVRRALHAACRSAGTPANQAFRLESSMERYFKSVFEAVNEDTLAGGLSNTIAGRICNLLNLRGGGYTVDGACSSSLLAAASAASALAAGDLDMALAGGVDVSLDPFELVGFAKAGALAMDDMRVYDRRGGGFIPGEGAGFVVLKRLEDARRDGDYVYAVLHGWGVSSDGAGTGVTAPNPDGQALALERAYTRAPYDIGDLDFIEGHGTGTTVGDRVELEAVSKAMGGCDPGKGRFCGMTSLKSIIGHAKAASGIGGFIKGVMAVNRRVRPPTAGCEKPHDLFGEKAGNLFPVLRGEIRHPKEAMKAGISSIGFGGINCHVTIESGDEPSPTLSSEIDERSLLASHQESEVFCFSADATADMVRKIREIAVICDKISLAELADLAANLSRETDHRAEIRVACMAGDVEELVRRLERTLQLLEETPPEENGIHHEPDRAIWIGRKVHRRRIALLFPGQGSQKINMARMLVDRFPWARDMLQQADAVLEKEGAAPVSDIVFKTMERAGRPGEAELWFRALSQTENAQPAICLASALWLRFLNDIGVQPAAVGGHSLGELSAFYAADAFDLPTLIRLAAIRGRAMAAPGDAAGAMASLKCDRELAEEILARVEEYVILANINGPRQMVLSGTRDGVDAALAEAEKRGIHTYRLSISNAFHSRMADHAAKTLKAVPFLSPRSESLHARLFSSRDGREITPTTDLNAHFAEQVISPVDFPAMVGAMSGLADLFIEVGPGRVLSGLVDEINGSRGPVCMPAASLPGMDRDLNRLMAALFAHGAPVNWEVFYSQRLIRPFVSPDKALFIVNPCERPFPDESEDNAARPGIEPVMGSLERALHDAADLTEEALQEYLRKRGPFLADVILADLKHARPDDAAPKPVSGASAPKERIAGSTRDALFQVVHEITGFPPASLSLDARLLDDLNMDSIKAGELIAMFARRIGLPDEIEVESLANASLSELIALAENRRPGRAASPGDETTLVKDALLASIERITGFAPDSLTMEMRLLDDLNMDSIKAGDLLADALKKTGATPEAVEEPQKLFNATLAEIVKTLERTTPDRLDPGTETPTLPADAAWSSPGWVREFAAPLVAIPDDAPSEGARKRVEEEWREGHALILGNQANDALARSLADRLTAFGVRVEAPAPGEFTSERLSGPSLYTHIIVILSPPSDRDDARALRSVIRTLGDAASPPTSPGRGAMLAYVQFGGGFFGTRGPVPDFHQCCAGALARSVHLERADLRVRVLDFSRSLDNETVVDKIMEELPAESGFVAAGYDADAMRMETEPRLLRPALYRKTQMKWSREDVIVATGGAKGITASCALALARETGARMALVGRSVPPDMDAPFDDPIVRTLHAYESAGVEARYYSCDVVEIDSLAITLAAIREEMGPITGVIHGAGLNKPRPIRETGPGDAFKEVSPKVMGALNLASLLSDAPPARFVGLTSIIGVCGMPGNAWYGFSNEALDLILRRFREDHPETATQSIAYSIWRDEGMGARMGSVESLKRMGVDAIPTEEGIRRFVRLFLHDPGAHQVIVAARLDGLDTWALKAPPPLEKARFLETLLHATPGVESLFTCRLTLETDPYLQDHFYNGSHLFPTVFGLEAMAQAASHVTGGALPAPPRVEKISLKRPITVDPVNGAEIVVGARVEEAETAGSGPVVRAWVSKASDRAGADSFSAVFLPGKTLPPETKVLTPPREPTAIDPARDLYHEDLCFQGPLFQRIRDVWTYTPQGDTAKSTLLSATLETGAAAARAAFPDPAHQRLFLGDPFFRDAMLHTVQTLTPKASCLPVFIGGIDIHSNAPRAPGVAYIHAELDHLEDRDIKSSVIAMDKDGAVLERLEDYNLKIIRRKEDNPGAADFARPDAPDREKVQTRLHHSAERLHPEEPSIDFSKYDYGDYPMDGFEHLLAARHTEFVKCAHGHEAFAMRIPLGFRPNAQLSRTVYFTNYMFWIGEIREVSIWPVLRKVVDQFATGKWGIVTNHSHLRILGEATARDHMEIRFWALNNYGPADSTMDLSFDFRKILPDGRYERLALCDQQVTWVRILEHGVVKPEAYPAYYWDFMKPMLPVNEDVDVVEPLPESLEPLHREDADDILYKAPSGPVVRPLIHEHIIETSLDCSNLVGNIYFANYYLWQGQTRDRYFFGVIPEHYRGTGEAGELLCLDCKVYHLREAMPFDRIVVTMALEELKTTGAAFYFEYFRQEPDRSRTKLAHGSQKTVWVKRDSKGAPHPSPFPDKALEAFERAIRKDG